MKNSVKPSFDSTLFQERVNLSADRGVRLRAQAAQIGSTVKKESGHIVKSIRQKVGGGLTTTEFAPEMQLTSLPQLCVKF